MEKLYFPITTDITTHQHYINLTCIYFYPIKLDKSILFPHYTEYQIMYEDSAVRPTDNIELFMTSILKYLP